MNIIQYLRNMREKKPTTKAFFAKDAEGQWWFFGIYSNKFMDFVGDILTKESHEDYINWLKDTGFQPVITVHHMPRAPRWFWPLIFEKYENDVKTLQAIVDNYYKEFAFAKAERVVYVNGFVAVAAKVLAGKEWLAEKLSALPDLGMSHGFIDKDSDANIFNKYRTFEMSTLRSVRAANPFTLSQVLQKGLSIMKGNEEKGLKPEDRAFLVDLFGEDVINKFESRTETAEGILSKILDYKDDIMGGKQQEGTVETPESVEAEVVETAEKVVEQPADETKEETPTEQPELTLQAVATGTAEAFTQLHGVLTKMQQQIEQLSNDNAELRKQLSDNVNELKEIKKSDDEKIASQWLPAFNWSAGYSPSTANDNVIKNEQEKEEVMTAPPVGTNPNTVDAENPLVMGFWSQLPAIMSNQGQ